MEQNIIYLQRFSVFPLAFQWLNSKLIRYKTGRLDFGRINPINEGFLVVILLGFLMGFKRQVFLLEISPILSMTNESVAKALVYIFLVGNSLLSLIN